MSKIAILGIVAMTILSNGNCGVGGASHTAGIHAKYCRVFFDTRVAILEKRIALPGFDEQQKGAGEDALKKLEDKSAVQIDDCSVVLKSQCKSKEVVLATQFLETFKNEISKAKSLEQLKMSTSNRRRLEDGKCKAAIGKLAT